MLDNNNNIKKKLAKVKGKIQIHVYESREAAKVMHEHKLF